MRDFGATALSCTPSCAMHLADAARERGLRPEDLPIRVGFHGAEPWTNELRLQIEAGLGIDAPDIYGLCGMGGPGVAFDCLCKAGMHVSEDHHVAEIIDPETLRPLPEGEVGELVLTTLSREAQPLIRYRTGDLCSLTSEPCACGRTSARMSKPIGRSDDRLIIRGVNVFPSQIEEVLMSFPEIEPHHQIVVDCTGYLDVIEVWVEVDEDIFAETMGDLGSVSSAGCRRRSATCLASRSRSSSRSPRRSGVRRARRCASSTGARRPERARLRERQARRAAIIET